MLWSSKVRGYILPPFCTGRLWSPPARCRMRFPCCLTTVHTCLAQTLGIVNRNILQTAIRVMYETVVDLGQLAPANPALHLSVAHSKGDIDRARLDSIAYLVAHDIRIFHRRTPCEAALAAGNKTPKRHRLINTQVSCF